MKNIEKYEKEIKNKIKENGTFDCAIKGVRGHVCDEDFRCTNCGLKSLDWLLEEYKEPILDDIEKEYLSAVIKPFRKRIKSINKTDYSSNSAFISITMDKCEHILLPVFELKSGMYQRMENNKNYTLEELGL